MTIILLPWWSLARGNPAGPITLASDTQAIQGDFGEVALAY